MSGEQLLQLAGVCTTCDNVLEPEKTVKGRPEYQRKIPPNWKPPRKKSATLFQLFPQRRPCPQGNS
jgi:hypothetical protein